MARSVSGGPYAPAGGTQAGEAHQTAARRAGGGLAVRAGGKGGPLPQGVGPPRGRSTTSYATTCPPRPGGKAPAWVGEGKPEAKAQGLERRARSEAEGSPAALGRRPWAFWGAARRPKKTRDFPMGPPFLRFATFPESSGMGGGGRRRPLAVASNAHVVARGKTRPTAWASSAACRRHTAQSVPDGLPPLAATCQRRPAVSVRLQAQEPPPFTCVSVTASV